MPNDALQQFYNSFRIPQQGQQQPGPQAQQVQIPQLTPAKQSVNPAGQLNQMIEQGRGGDNTVNYAGGGAGGSQGGPLSQYLANAMTTAGNNSAMTSMGGFNNPGAQVGLNNISWGAPAAGAATGAAAGGSTAGSGIMSMLASLL